MKKRPIVLCIMDGYGISESINGNAVRLANTPNLDDLMAMYPNTTISASGMPVGLPDGQMGNSEVGHLNIGAGRGTAAVCGGADCLLPGLRDRAWTVYGRYLGVYPVGQQKPAGSHGNLPLQCADLHFAGAGGIQRRGT